LHVLKKRLNPFLGQESNQIFLRHPARIVVACYIDYAIAAAGGHKREVPSGGSDVLK
jgi:hypothetical protein